MARTPGSKNYPKGTETKQHNINLPTEASEAVKKRLAETGLSLPQYFLRLMQLEESLNVSSDR